MKGLEALESLAAVLCDLEIDEEGFPKWFLTGKRGEEFLIIKKELKALEIIKEKNVNVTRIKNDQVDLVYYNWKERKENQLTQEEYNLLREVLCEKLQKL